MKIALIIPTYNEKENIGLLIDGLQDEFAKMSHEIKILVVDDDSPDGTAAVVKEKTSRHGNVLLITGRKEGLGAAYIRGMTYAMDVLETDAVMGMDADFSHKPEDVPRLVAALEEGADFVIGSRYVEGGKVPENWGLRRRLNSKVGNIVARYIAGMHNVKDCTAGFRAIRTAVLKRIDLNDLNVRGYAFLVTILSRAIENKAIIREIPVEYVDRTRGETKLGLTDVIEFIINACWIRFRTARRTSGSVP